jgi:DNA repair protein RadA/Sms
VTVTLEGRRPLVAEVQALVSPSDGKFPRRAVTGLESARVSMLAAVLEKHARIKLSTQEVYASTVGGVTLGEPAVDLAVVLALAGSAHDFALPSATVAIGEVGLSGGVRPVTGLARRIAEAARLGFTRAIVPQQELNGTIPAGVTVLAVQDVSDALSVGAVRSSRGT